MTDGAPVPSPWEDALLIAALFAIDPVGLVGVTIRAGPTAARDGWLAAVRDLFREGAPIRRAASSVADDRLLGGLDLSASLAAGRPVAQRGLLAECDGGLVIFPMAERIEDSMAARVASVLDQGVVVMERDGLTDRQTARLGVILLDEGIEPEERAPESLIERLAFRLDLASLTHRDLLGAPVSKSIVAEARARLEAIGPPDEMLVEALCAASIALDIPSARATLLALKAARAHAALRGGDTIDEADVSVGARFVLAPRARAFPSDADDASPPPPPEEPDDANETPPDPLPQDEDQTATQAERVIEAIRALLPDNLLEQLQTEGGPRARVVGTRGSGDAAKSARRGRPVGSRPGALRPGDRLNLVETLRAATPWQKLRRPDRDPGRIEVRQSDFRIRRFVQRAESTTIFVVDASGSSAFQRLAEAKGAVELLLAKAYVTRTRVALVSFRGPGADILLPPTRSLTRAKRRLADLPGGGGTPLAAGIEAALGLALMERGAERTPSLVFLTDGRANIGRDGAPGRGAAEADALVAARQVRQAGIGAIYLDTSPRPAPGGDRFARAMGAVYAPLPYANADSMARIVDGLTGARG